MAIPPEKLADPAEVAGRMRWLIETELGYKPGFFADEVGVSRQTISNILLGKSKPNADTMIALLAKYPHLDLAWLLTGAGSGPFPRGQKGDQLVTPAPNVLQELQEEKALLQEEVDHLVELLRITQDRNRKSGGSAGPARPLDDAPRGPRPLLSCLRRPVREMATR